MVTLDKLEVFDLKEKLEISESDLNDIDEMLCSNEIIIVIKRFSDLQYFLEKWKETVHFTAGYIQNKLEEIGFNNNVAWDMYIFFIVNFDVNANTISDIEKDKFCCKKYVVDIRGHLNEKNAIISHIPLFAAFDMKFDSSISIMNDVSLKTKITSGLNNKVVDSFRDIDFIDDTLKCNSLLKRLKESYIHE